MTLRRLRVLLALTLALGLAGALAARPAWAEDRAEPEPTPREAAKGLIQQMRSEDPEERLVAAQGARTNPCETLTSPLVKLLSDKSVVVRMAAIEALAARTDKGARKKAASSLAARVDRLEKGAAEREELMATLDALRELAQPGPIKGLIGGIKTDSDPEVVEARLMAVAAVPSKEAIDRLIQFLAKGRRGQLGAQRRAAAKALQYATGERGRGLGNDPDRWRAWWRENEKTFDFDDVAAAREAAAQEAAEKRRKAEERKARRDEARKKKAERRKQGKKDKGRDKGADSGTDA